MINSIVAIILVLGGLIFFHELGHFLVARLCGVGVKTFSLGFGPKIFAFTRGKTQYRLSLVPLGGFVNMAGEHDDMDYDEFDPPEFFNNKPAWQRMCIVAAGPVFNFILAWVIYSFLFFANGQTKLLPVIGDLQQDGPAQAAGLAPKDRIITVNGQKTLYWENLSDIIKKNLGNPLELTVDRDGTLLNITVIPTLQTHKNIFGEEIQVPMIGITSAGETAFLPMDGGSSIVEAGKYTWEVSVLTLQGLVKIVERIVPLESVGGPIMIAQMVSQQAQEGFTNVMALAAVISINLGLLNLLPIPVLDGGHILYIGIEMITRRPLSERVRDYATRFGLLFLFGLMLLAIYNDLARIFKAPV